MNANKTICFPNLERQNQMDSAFQPCFPESDGLDCPYITHNKIILDGKFLSGNLIISKFILLVSPAGPPHAPLTQLKGI